MSKLTPRSAEAAKKAALAAGFDFEAEAWEPPTKELRKQRADFYGPLTQEMLDRAIAGECGNDEGRPSAAALIAKGKKALQHESVTIRAKGRWAKSMQRAKMNVKVGGALKSLSLDKWFVTWQEKKCVKLPPVYKKPLGEAEEEGEAEIDFNAGDSEEEELDEDGLPVKKEKQEGYDSDGNELPDDGEDDLLPSGPGSRPGSRPDTADTAGSGLSDADAASLQVFEVGDEVVLHKRLKKKKVIGDVLLPSVLCNVTYGPDAKGDMKIKRQSDGKELRYVKAKDIEHTRNNNRTATGSPESRSGGGRAKSRPSSLSATADGAGERGSSEPVTFGSQAPAGVAVATPKSSAKAAAARSSVPLKLTSGILDSRGFLKKVRPSTAAAVVPKDPETVGMRLICFPCEGANTGIFEAFSWLVKKALVVAVQYPGRMNRCKELPAEDVRPVAAACVQAMLGQGLLATPYAFLGHGLGALVAYECARLIRSMEHSKDNQGKKGVKPPALFCAVQAEGPQAFDDDHGGEARHEEPDEGLLEHLVSLERGCLPLEVTEQPALFGLAAPLFRADTKAYETYRYESDWPFAHTPFYVVVGEYDGRYSRDTLQLWDQETLKEFELRMLPCGAREMFRDPTLIAETAAFVDSKIDFELKRPIDPDADIYGDLGME